MAELTLAQAREAVADALAALTVTASPPFALSATVRPPRGQDRRAGQAWTVVGEVTPAGYVTAHAEVTAVVVLGSDVDRADEIADLLTVPALNAVTSAVPAADVTAVREILLAGESSTAPLYVLTVTATTEVS